MNDELAYAVSAAEQYLKRVSAAGDPTLALAPEVRAAMRRLSGLLEADHKADDADVTSHHVLGWLHWLCYQADRAARQTGKRRSACSGRAWWPGGRICPSLCCRASTEAADRTELIFRAAVELTNPGLLPGRPITPARLADRLRALGIPCQSRPPRRPYRSRGTAARRRARRPPRPAPHDRRQLDAPGRSRLEPLRRPANLLRPEKVAAWE
jgi:hypothetical protein